MRVGTNAWTQGCLNNDTQMEIKSRLIHERRVRVTHTYELDRSKEGIT